MSTPAEIREGALVGRRPAAVPLHLDCPRPWPGGQPATGAVSFPKGTLEDSAVLHLLDPAGRRAAVQTRPLARWSDGSVKWLLLDAVLDQAAQGSPHWTLGPPAGEPHPSPCEALRMRAVLGGIVVETGAAAFHLGPGPGLLGRVQVDGRDLVAPGSVRVVLVDRRGRERPLQVEGVAPEACGPVRATVRIEGRFEGRFARPGPLRFVARACFFAGTGLVRLRLTVQNPRRARHPGGIWDLGDPGSVFFHDLALALELAGADPLQVDWVAEDGQPPRSTGGDLEIYQDSSGGEQWASRNHVNRHGRVPCSFRGYRARAAGREERGLRASPVVAVRGPAGRVAAAIPEFWQQFPKALEVRGRTLRAGLFPAQGGDPFELQGGEQKTHAVWLDFGPAAAAAGLPLGWVHRPARLRAAPGWDAASGALPHCLPVPAAPGDRLEAELAAVVAGPRNFFARREIIDEYGWRNFGEVYADHEAAHYPGPPPVISHYNNQYDLIYGMGLQYGRTGDGRWFDLLDPLARHVVDIDIYHTRRDRAAYNGGLFWHTDHYRDAATCTHRAFSRANRPPAGGPYGGGPCGEHNYTTGLLHYYYLTGDEGARAAVLGLADWVIQMDDGRRTLLGLIDPGATGSASRTRDRDYHGPGRGAGNSINALIDGWLLSGHRRYLDQAEALIRRTIHPGDDIAARELLETERRWSYTVHLAALARYLDVKAEAGAPDAMYAYARAALLAYAAWMLEHEVPYFDRPEQLEFPTETWAAQEFRKANVLRLAAAHADEPLRAKLLARGDALADRARDDLLRFATRDVARPVAILLREATRDAYFRARGVAPAPRPPGDPDFGAPARFVGQKERVLARWKAVPDLARAALRLAARPARWGRRRAEASGG